MIKYKPIRVSRLLDMRRDISSGRVAKTIQRSVEALMRSREVIARSKSLLAETRKLRLRMNETRPMMTEIPKESTRSDTTPHKECPS